MIYPINNYSITSLNYQNKNNPNFTGLNNSLKRLSPYNFYMEKVFDRYTHISKNRWMPIDEVIKPNLNVLKLSNGKYKTEAWEINPNNKKKKYIIFFHGLGQNISSNQDIYKKILKKGYAVLAPEYGEFGSNTDKMTAKVIKKQTAMALEYLNKKGIPNENIGVIGFSMGSFPAIEMASKNKNLKFLVLISPFNSLRNEVELLTKGTTIRLPKLLKYSIDKFPFLLNHIDNIFKTNKKLKSIEAPVYLIHSSNDKIVPQKSTEDIANKVMHLKQFILLEKGGHVIEENKLNAFDQLKDI
ncbi:uncharacterized protein BN776_00929 [Clostridium sp. CAG:768]|nr:uncharacterized protein BN776_00929 [Clostridium sp. CAG:768]